MSRPPLRLYSSCESPHSSCATGSASDQRRERELDRITGTATAKTVAVSFGDFVKLLAQAIDDQSTWLTDFADDTIRIDADLHEVLLSYQRIRQNKAA